MSGRPGQSTPLHEPEGLAVEFVTQSALWAEGGIAHAPLEAAARAAYGAAGGRGPAEVALVLSDDARVRGLNREWRGKDAATDVLSFPGGDFAAQGGPRALGDIVLAFETAARDAAGAGAPLTAHASHLVIHGLLHLLGYDHAALGEALAMERLESEIMTRLGLHDPYGLTADTRA